MEDAVATVHEDDADLFFRDVLVVPRRFVEQIEDLPSRLHAGVAAPHDYESEEPAPHFLAVLGIGLLDPGNDRGAQDHRVTHILHHESMLGHPGDAAEINLGPEPEDDVAELENDSGRETACIHEHFFFHQIDVLDLSPQDLEPSAELADRIDDVTGSDRGTRDFGEHGLENHVVLFGHDDRLVRRQSCSF